MQSSTFRWLSTTITLSLIATLAVFIGLTLRHQPTLTIKPAPTPSTTSSPTAAATPFQTLGADLSVLEGGYRFQPLAGYDATMQGAAVAMTRQVTVTVADAGATSTIGLDAPLYAARDLRPDLSLEELVAQVAQSFIEQTQAQHGDVERITIDGVAAAALSIEGTLAGAPLAGRIVVAPRPDRLFIAAATAPLAIWEAETSPALQYVLDSVVFFTPTVAAAQPTAAALPTPRPEVRATPLAPTAGAPPTTQPVPALTPEAGIPAASATPSSTVTSPVTNLVTSTVTNLVTSTVTSPVASTVTVTVTSTATDTDASTVTALLILTPTPSPAAGGVSAQPWSSVTDGNWMNELVVAGNTIWVASDGGALAWTRGSTSPVKFTSINGLTDNRLTAVAACGLPDLGVLFGSNAGLQVVDPGAGGWRQLDSSNSELSYDDISSLVCNPAAGYLVIGYARHGIDVFDATRNTWRHLDRNSGLASNNVRALAVVGDLDEIWVAGDDGVTVAAGADSTFYTTSNSPLESTRIGALVASPDGAVWLGGDGVLYRVAGEQWSVFRAETVDDPGFPVRLITGMAFADNGDLWLGDIDGVICRFDPATERCAAAFRSETGMASAPLTHLALDADGQVYYTTAGDGFSIFDGAAWTRFARRNESIRGNAIQAATVDPAGDLWVVTEAGVQRVARPGQEAVLLPDSTLAPATMRTIYAAANGDIWVGGAGAGIWDGAAWRVFTTTDGLAGSVVQAISEDGRGRIWLGADQGISVWNGLTFVNLDRDTGLPNADIRALLRDGDAMWIGSGGGGLYRYARNQLEVFNVDNVNLPSDTITALATSSDGTLLVGSDAGLAELRDGGAAPLPAIGERAITHVLAPDGSIWVGTTEDGLFYDVGDGWEHATTASALPTNRVTALVQTSDAVWVGGATGGLLRYSMISEE